MEASVTFSRQTIHFDRKPGSSDEGTAHSITQRNDQKVLQLSP